MRKIKNIVSEEHSVEKYGGNWYNFIRVTDKNGIVFVVKKKLIKNEEYIDSLNEGLNQEYTNTSNWI